METIKDTLEKALTVVMPLVNLSTEEREIYDAIFTGETDAALEARIGVTKKQIRGKRQNIHSKIGYKFLDLLSIHRSINK